MKISPYIFLLKKRWKRDDWLANNLLYLGIPPKIPKKRVEVKKNNRLSLGIPGYAQSNHRLTVRRLQGLTYISTTADALTVGELARSTGSRRGTTNYRHIKNAATAAMQVTEDHT